MDIPNFNELSVKITKEIGKDEKKENGIFFTPLNTIKRTMKYLQPYMNNIKNVLEPSCGSCEFILWLLKYHDTLLIDGIELHPTIFNYIQNIESIKTNPNVTLFNQDYLKFKIDKKYDLIIGNPPYFVMKKKDVSNEYYPYFDGRPNIFILFIMVSLEKLNPNGILSFVLPKNFLNCIYYDKTRKVISEKYSIIAIDDCEDDFLETKQETILLIIQKKIPNEQENKEYILQINNYTIFGMKENIQKMNYLYCESTTLKDLNFSVNVGNVVWNQCKDILTNDSSYTQLIYSSDITKNKLNMKTYKNEMKKNYIQKEGINTPSLVINRGYGKGTYKFDYCLIEGGFEYLIENHLICIKYNDIITNKELVVLYKKIIKSLQNEKTIQFIELYFGNNAINTTELCHILPIYI